jgi:uncharacterized FAD-dependent dehydrogenase
MITDITLRVKPETSAKEKLLQDVVATKMGINVRDITAMRVIKRSIDARSRQVWINLTVRVAVAEKGSPAVKDLTPEWSPIQFDKLADNAKSVIIVGAGPAGLFGALQAIRLGVRPVVLERGLDVDSRRLDIANISRTGKINPKSNYCFGEGGAGAYSDGKLYTRSKKRGNVEDVLRIFVQFGASKDILIDAHPHIGSDKLPGVIRAMREKIIECGGDVYFDTTVTGLLLDDAGAAVGVSTDKSEYRADGVILATGHSAHDTFRALHSQGIEMEPKGIAIGVRLEHPQKLIDQLQYHSTAGRGEYLPAAEYCYVTQVEGRGVYSFCMCPGGVIVPAGSDDNQLVVNGMSASARAGKWSNSGMVVEIHPGDFPEFQKEGALEMLALQEHLEKHFFKESGNSINAPAQCMRDFTDGKVSRMLPATSYAPGIHPADFNILLPPFISWRLRQGFLAFGRKSNGFLTNEALLVGLESRTSSPIRISRDKESMVSLSTPGLYPVGEGAGYAGGIVSAAIDGMRAATAFAAAVNNDKSE